MRGSSNRRVHASLLDPADLEFIPPAAFRAIDDEISVEWAKYTNANATLLRSRDPRANGLVELKALHVRGIDPLDVIHAPIKDNRAHSNIIGFQGLPKTKLTKLRLQLSMKAIWIVKPGNQPNE